MPEPRPSIDLPHLLRNFPEPVFVLHQDGTIAAANRAAEELCGLALADLTSRHVREILSSESHALMLSHIESSGVTFTANLELIHASGAPVAVDVHAVRDESGLVQFTAREAASPRLSQDMLRHSEMRFRFMAKNLTEMVLAYDMNRRLTFVNPPAATLTGYSPEDIENAGFIDWIYPEDRQRMLAYWDRLFEGTSFHEEEYRLVTRDGRIKWVAASWGPILDDHGRQVGVQGREREVTERHMAEESLRQSEQRHRHNEQRYRALFEDSPFPMWEEDFSQLKIYLAQLRCEGVTDLRSHLAAHPDVAAECLRCIRVLDVNRAARDFYGAETKEELLQGLDQIFDEAAWDNFREEVAELDATNLIYKSEFQTRTFHGDDRTVSMIVSIATPEDWSRVIVTFFDITDRKRLEEQVLQSQKLESLGRLAGGIAHDFNNLLMVVLGYSDLLLAEAGNIPSLARGLKEIKTAGERGAELTAQLLAFSRKQIAQPRPLDLNGLIRQSLGMLQRVIGEDIHLQIALAPGIWNIKADRGQLHQVLMNLVGNGREAMPRGGTLSLATGNRTGEPAEGDYVLLEVRDTGAGMDETARQNIFEPFFAKGRGKSTGLGMATVFSVVTQAGGQIAVDSEPGKGTVLRVYFPRDNTPAAPDSTNRDIAPPAAARGRVLVVEDQSEVRMVACTILRNLGLEVLEASDGKEALDLADTDEGAIDLLLTDVIMPGLNGRVLAARFASKRPRTKVIYMSGYTDRIMSPDGLLDSSVAFLQKPFKPEELARLVSKALAG